MPHVAWRFNGRTVARQVTTLDTVTVQTPQVVMVSEVQQRQKITMQKQVVDRQTTVKVGRALTSGLFSVLTTCVVEAYSSQHSPLRAAKTHTHNACRCIC